MSIAKYWKPIAAAVVVVGLVAFGVILKMGHDGLERSSKAAAELEAAKAGSSQCYSEALQGGSAPACTGSPTTTPPAKATEIPSRVATLDEQFDLAFTKANGQILVETNTAARQVGRDYCAKADSVGAFEAVNEFIRSAELQRGLGKTAAFRATYAAVRSYCPQYEPEHTRWRNTP